MAIRLRMGTATEVRRTLARVANMALNGKIDTKTEGLNEQKCDKTEKFHFCLYLIIVYC